MLNIAVKVLTIASICSIYGNGARILGVFPHPSHSHQVVFHALASELSKRGHELVVFTPYPIKDPDLKNYTQADLSPLRSIFKSKVDFYKVGSKGLWNFLHTQYKFNEMLTDQTLAHPLMQKLIAPNSTEKFDLIILQCLYYDALYALSARFNAPMIGVSSLPLMAIHQYKLGNPYLMSYSPDPFVGHTDQMDLWGRIVNVYYYLRQIYEYLYIILPTQETIKRKYFGDTVPSVQVLHKNLSMVFINTHPFFTYPRANVPALLHIGGCRGGNKNKQLPEELKEILDNATQGFIYFSLGSNLKSTDLPLEARNAFMDAFREIPYMVLWKFESDDLVNKPKNVIIRKWLPQQLILAHPNIVLFMYQGGLQSTEEAIDSKVPVIGLPLFSDQISNLNRLEALGIGKQLKLQGLTNKILKDTIMEVVLNSSYKENAVKFSNLFHDLPQHPMDHAVWWTEHIIRHKGAPHLYNRSRDLPWYKVELLDVLLVYLISFAFALYVAFVIVLHSAKKIVQISRHLKPRVITLPKKNE